jgi:hypothetical protein
MKGKQPAGSAINRESVGIVGSGSAGRRENGLYLITGYLQKSVSRPYFLLDIPAKFE